MKPTESQLTALLITSEGKNQIQVAFQEASDTLQGVQSFPCEVDSDVADLSEILGVVRARLKELEEDRTSITKPLNAAKRAVDAFFNPTIKLLEKAEETIRQKINTFASTREQARQKALAEAREAARLALPPPVPVLALEPPPVPSGIYFKPVWTWAVADIHQVPREFLMVNPMAVEALLAPFKDSEQVPQVPGFTFTREQRLVPKG